MTKYVGRLIHAVTRRGEAHESSTREVVGAQHEEESVNIPANPVTPRCPGRSSPTTTTLTSMTREGGRSCRTTPYVLRTPAFVLPHPAEIRSPWIAPLPGSAAGRAGRKDEVATLLVSEGRTRRRSAW
ncbi:MAG: hypothetical protein U9R47_08820 [Actinomycetota bacterium]|nr:hypothetical protein [Actinomycetota bacterium]